MLVRLGLSGGFALLLAGPTVAAPLVAAELTIGLGPVQAIFPGDGVVGSAASDLLVSLEPGIGFRGQATPASLVHLDVFRNAAGTLAGTTPGNLGGSLPFTGDWGLPNQTFFFPPLRFGVATTTGSTFVTLEARAFGRPWTVGKAQLKGPLSFIPSGVTLSATGRNGLTPRGAGTLVLVTPIVVDLLQTSFDERFKLGAFGVLTLEFAAPEPSTTWLIVVAALGVFGASALRRQR